ncbi:MAG: BREX-1 system phosphatase PglZ type A, partial [Planctomycetota bacterium]|nr:BREX-1 system phosphatase PglZ type A [Planctomycetota bacterium]
ALLPHDTLEFLDQATGTISVSGQATAGLENRKTVLEAFSEDTATTAIHATDLMALKTGKVKELVRDHDVIYVYHNVIDATGDASKTEDAVFEATERALEQLSNLVRKLTSGNAKQLILTCDHGFIYQHRKITDSDYLNEKPSGDIQLLDRRFVIGEKLQETENFKKFSAEQLGIVGTQEILFPKSINRLRKSGSGARYVHGGLSLQEIVLPVLKIRKGEVGDVTPVSVIISPGNTKTITTSQLAVRLYQEDPVTEKNHARTLRVGMYSSEGVLVSDSQIHRFDSESDNPRDRESQIRLLLTKSADGFDGQEVMLRLEEQHGNTSHYSTYREQRYVLNRSLGNDFDF